MRRSGDEKEEADGQYRKKRRQTDKIGKGGGRRTTKLLPKAVPRAAADFVRQLKMENLENF